MDKKIIFIDQPRFLGDIIFVMAIAQKYVNDGYLVEFPIDDQYLGPHGIQKYFPNVNLLRLSEYSNYYKYHNSKILEDATHKYFLLSDSTYRSVARKHMQGKYLFIGLNFETWRTIKIARDYEMEEKLMSVVGVEKGEKFNLVNEYYSDEKIAKMRVVVDNNYRNIYMSKIPGFSIFDWMGLIEKAESIHTVHTALHYLLDIMPNITSNLHIYLRSGIYEPHSYYKDLFQKKYVYHGQKLNLLFEMIGYARRIKRSYLSFFRSVGKGVN